MMSNNGTILKGAGYMAKLKFYDCESNYECIKACPEKAITQGPERLPSNTCSGLELLPGKPEIDHGKMHRLWRLRSSLSQTCT